MKNIDSSIIKRKPQDFFGIKRTQDLEATIIIPCYNEEKRISSTRFLSFLSWHKQIRFLFVNDGSRDNTLELLYKMKAHNPEQVDVLDLEKNSGKAEAVRFGMKKALEDGDQYIGFWDADLATPLDAIEDLMRVFSKDGEMEIVYGTRRAMLGHKIERDWKRRIVSRSCASLARLAIGLPVTDTQCGAKIFKSTPNLKRALSAPFEAGWLFDIELLTRLIHKIEAPRAKIYEYPLAEWTEIPGSNIDTRTVIRAGFMMLKLIAKIRFGTNETDRGDQGDSLGLSPKTA